MAEQLPGNGDGVERNEAQDQNHPMINPQHLAVVDHRAAPNVVNPVGRIHRFPPSAYLTPPSQFSRFNPFLTQFSFRKELKASDVGPAKRIVIPKALAERHLPHLDQSEGVIMYMTDMDDYGVWEFKFRFWNNNGSRMFVLERTGDFVRSHDLRAGDFIMIYQDMQSGRLGIRGRRTLPPAVISQVEMMRALGNYNILDGRAANVNTIALDPNPMTGGYLHLQPSIYGNNNNNTNVMDGGVQMINNISPAAVVGGGGEVELPPLPPALPPPPPSATQADPLAFDLVTGPPPPDSSSTCAGPDESDDDWLSFLHAAIR